MSGDNGANDYYKPSELHQAVQRNDAGRGNAREGKAAGDGHHVNDKQDPQAKAAAGKFMDDYLGTLRDGFQRPPERSSIVKAGQSTLGERPGEHLIAELEKPKPGASKPEDKYHTVIESAEKPGEFFENRQKLGFAEAAKLKFIKGALSTMGIEKVSLGHEGEFKIDFKKDEQTLPVDPKDPDKITTRLKKSVQGKMTLDKDKLTIESLPGQESIGATISKPIEVSVPIKLAPGMPVVTPTLSLFDSGEIPLSKIELARKTAGVQDSKKPGEKGSEQGQSVAQTATKPGEKKGQDSIPCSLTATTKIPYYSRVMGDVQQNPKDIDIHPAVYDMMFKCAQFAKDTSIAHAAKVNKARSEISSSIAENFPLNRTK